MAQKIKEIKKLSLSNRIQSLKEDMLNEKRYVSLEQAHIITDVYKKCEGKPVIIKRAEAFRSACELISIRIDKNELIVGNRTTGIRAGVVSPESGISWIDKELETLPTRPQDKFLVRNEDMQVFRKEILPYWKGKTLEDQIYAILGEELSTLETVVKINQKDHAQGHICPNTEKWLKLGITGLLTDVENNLSLTEDEEKRVFLESVKISLKGAQQIMVRYGNLAKEMAEDPSNVKVKTNLQEISRICYKLSENPPETFRESLQSVWFLYFLLQLESNASSFSPGRMDQYLYPYFKKDIESGNIGLEDSLELIEALWLKFNQIVYLRNASSAKYFAGFPIGFNVAIGGQNFDGSDASNELSYLFLKAQEHIGLPQPNLSARLFSNSSQDFILECSRVIGTGSGMPQIFNDDAVIPALIEKGIEKKDAINYAIVGCVELTTHGNNLGWSDAAMFNMVKVLELTLNDGKCLLTGKQLGLKTGTIASCKTYEELEAAFTKQLYYFIERMIPCCEVVEKKHAQILPSPFLSSVIDDCLVRGIDVTAGGAKYNLSGIQAIQVANVADSLAVLKMMYESESESARFEVLEALRNNFEEHEILRNKLLYKYPKYGNDVEWVDAIGNHWIAVFDDYLKHYTNVRGGIYHTGLYTVSAHVPMGQNVGATPDGRKAKEPLADGGMSAVYGRDTQGPTALLKSVSRINSMRGSNGTLLNMKFLPQMFETEEGLQKFSALLRAVVHLKIIHVQFNVLNEQDLLEAQKYPERYKSLTVRVAGYTAYFTELATDLQNEIIARTSYGVD